jgi:serine O-acetyltransferase
MNEIARYHWGVEETVAQLRSLRLQSLEDRNRRHKPPKLPSRKELQQILDGLSAVLFPNRLGRPDLTEEGIDYYVGYTLDRVLHELFKQIRRELQFISGNEGVDDAAHERAIEITRYFTSQLPAVRRICDSDIQAAYEGDPAARTPDEVLVCYPGITAIIYHRLAHILYVQGAPLVARMISELAHSATGIDIHPGARIGRHLFIDHGFTVIGETADIGDNVTIYQCVTLGGTNPANGIGGKRHPTLSDNVIVGSGAQILGPIIIGPRARVGANAVVTEDVPEGATMVGVKARSTLVAAETWVKDFIPYGTPCSELFDPQTQKLELMACQLIEMQKRVATLMEERDAKAGEAKVAPAKVTPAKKREQG